MNSLNLSILTITHVDADILIVNGECLTILLLILWLECGRSDPNVNRAGGMGSDFKVVRNEYHVNESFSARIVDPLILGLFRP